MDSTALFSKTPPLKLFFTAAVPGAISMLASSLYQLIDGILVGNFLDGTSFAALNLAMPFVIINFALSDLVGVGSSVPISVALGRGDRKEANNVFTCACLLILGAGVLMGTVMFTAAPFLIGMMGAEGDFAALAVQYLRTYALCSPFTTILYAADNYLRISGYIRGSMCINILMSVLCVTFEFVFLGVLDLGLWAAAFGASLGMFICVVLSFIPFVRGKALLRFVRPRFELRTLRQIVTCGCPTFLNNIGAQKFSRVRAIEKCCFTAAAAVSLLSAVVIALLPGPITRLFIAGAEGEALAIGVTALRIFSLTYLTRWLSFATQSYMLAVEKALPASILSVSTALVFPVILLAALGSLGLNGLWINFPATSAMAAVLAFFILHRTRADLHRPDAA